jgi:hypothetical protein
MDMMGKKALKAALDYINGQALAPLWAGECLDGSLGIAAYDGVGCLHLIEVTVSLGEFPAVPVGDPNIAARYEERFEGLVDPHMLEGVCHDRLDLAVFPPATAAVRFTVNLDEVEEPPCRAFESQILERIRDTPEAEREGLLGPIEHAARFACD